MTSGMYFTGREKEYIVANAEYMSRAQIAEALCKLYPEDNDGKRTENGVRAFLYRRKYKL